MQPIGLVAGRDQVIRDEARGELLPALDRRLRTRQIPRVGPLEEASLVLSFPIVIVVLDGEHSVAQRTGALPRIRIEMLAVRTDTPASPRGPRLLEWHLARGACSRIGRVRDFVEIAACRTDEDAPRVSPIRRKQIPWKQIDRLFAGRTVDRLYPEERLYGYLCVAVARAGRTIVLPDLVVQRLDEGSCGPFIPRQVEMLDLLANDPGRHRIDVKSLHVATETVRFDQRGSAAHKRISDSTTREVVGGKERVLQRALPELGKDQTTKQRARTPREPFVNADDRAIILLDLLFPEGQSGDHRNVEVSLDTHVPSCRVGETSAQTGSLNE